MSFLASDNILLREMGSHATRIISRWAERNPKVFETFAKENFAVKINKKLKKISAYLKMRNAKMTSTFERGREASISRYAKNTDLPFARKLVVQMCPRGAWPSWEEFFRE